VRLREVLDASAATLTRYCGGEVADRLIVAQGS
jgi:hypothetical protein